MSLDRVSGIGFRRGGSFAAFLSNQAIRAVLRIIMLHAPRFLALALAANIVAVSVDAAPVQNGKAQQPFRDGVVLVAFHDGTTPEQQAQVLAAAGAVEMRVI